MIKNILIAIGTLLVLVFSSNTANACSCSFQSLKDDFSSTDVVFIGKVIKNKTIKYAEVSMTLKESGTLEMVKNPKWEKTIEKIRSVTFEVSESFKGTTEKTFTLLSSYYTGGGSCGIRFKKDETYLIFAYKTQPLLSKEESEQPKENWTLEMQLNAEADEFNKYLPPFAVSVCSYTGNLIYMEKEVKAIRDFQKKGK
ncbi:MAG: hypothetical protein K1X72_06540 [Pyrinomonadaceae bacterium]|nr:hypothetical protein [Pyrinomonadaceae bacterium]